MNILFFDTETSGLPSDKLPIEHPQQARIVQFAACLTDELFKVRTTVSMLSHESDYDMHPKAEEVHKIRKIDAIKYGIPMSSILSTFQHLCDKADVLVSFNGKKFDCKLVDTECALNGKSIVYPDIHIDVMEVMTDICKLPSRWRGTTYKWPSLSEAYRHAFQNNFEDAHDALVDVNATIKIFSWLLEKNYLKISDGMILAS